MSYFSYGSRQRFPTDKGHCDTAGPAACLTELHHTLYDRFRAQSWDLYPYWESSRLVTSVSAAGGSASELNALIYLRSEGQARMVEENMGLESRSRGYGGISASRHPVIEVRDTPDHFAVELIISPDAWWDQQNVIGKLELDRHQVGLRGLLRSMKPDYCFGFWEGEHLSDMHLTARQLWQGRILNEWLGTFADGQDYLRFGVWYDRDDPALDPRRIANEVYTRLSDLYALYNFLVWSSNNNYRGFYEKRSCQRRYA
jgi:hypothetical protein